METERWKIIDDLLQSALELAPERREEFLRNACGADLTLADEVRSLMTSFRRAGGFLESPAVEVAARAIAAESAPSLAASRTGQIVSHYRLLGMIGSGGMGSVWLAERCDGRFDRKVAIKFIHLTLLDLDGAERFKREGAILGKLCHPQIAELIDAGLTASGEPYLALEYVEGQPIDVYCDRNKLGVDARIRLFLYVLSAVAHAHSNLVVHRDIKPTNVFIRKDGEVKLLDFGIAKVLSDEQDLTSAMWVTRGGSAALTPMFSAPEQLTQGQITTVTDIYSLGVLLYLLLTGQHPAGGGSHSPAQLIKTIVEQEPPRASSVITAASTGDAANRDTTPEKLQRHLRGDLDRIIGKAIKKDPAERYPSALAFAEDLHRYLEHRPILARPDSVGYRIAKFVRRNRAAVALAAVAFVALTAGLTWIVIQNQRVRTERDFAYRQLVRITQHDDFLDFLLSDAGPSGKPFTVSELLDRATRIVEKQKASSMQIELLDWIGADYVSVGEYKKAGPLLERAYLLSKQYNDPDIRASAACTLGWELAQDVNLARGEALIQEGLRTLPNDPQYAYDRITCLDYGGEVSLQKGDSSEAVRRMEMARRVLRASPLDSDALEMGDSLDLAGAYGDAGRDQEAIAEYNRAGALMSALGRDETETGVILLNGWALELEQVGRPLEAEKLLRRAIGVGGDHSTGDAMTSTVLDNYAIVQMELDHLPQAADYAERAYAKAIATGDELMTCQSLLDQVRVHRAQHDIARAESILSQVEPRLRSDLPPGHYGLSTIPTEHALIALEKKDFSSALRQMDEAIAIIQAAMKSGGAGSFALSGLYVYRSRIDLAMGRPDQAEADANLALAALQPAPGVSSKLGRALLAKARALQSENKTRQARDVARQALDQLQGSLGADHPDAQSARRLAE